MNLPDDWNNHYHQCHLCSSTYHASGTDVCRCVWCEHCGKQVAPEESDTDVNGDASCVACIEKNQDSGETCPACYSVVVVWLDGHLNCTDKQCTWEGKQETQTNDPPNLGNASLA